MMLSVVAGLADGDEPLDWFLPDIPFRISFVVDLGSWRTTIYAAPVIPFEHHITFSFPGVRLKTQPSVKYGSPNRQNVQ